MQSKSIWPEWGVAVSWQDGGRCVEPLAETDRGSSAVSMQPAAPSPGPGLLWAGAWCFYPTFFCISAFLPQGGPTSIDWSTTLMSTPRDLDAVISMLKPFPSFFLQNQSQPVCNSKEPQPPAPPAPPARLCCTQGSELLPRLLVSRLQLLIS